MDLIGDTSRHQGRLAGIILAAGESQRLGRPKQLLQLRGKPMLQRVLEASMESQLDEVVIVVGAASELVIRRIGSMVSGHFRFEKNNDFRRGQSSSLVTGLRALGDDIEAAVILLGDQPSITGALIDTIVSAYRGTELSIVRPVFTASGRRVPGHPVILHRDVWPQLLRLQGDEGARQLIRSQPGCALEVLIDGPELADVDTEEDYRRLQAATANLVDKPLDEGGGNAGRVPKLL